MLFNSSSFLIFFPIVTLVYFILPHKIRYIWLLISSYYFYMCWNPAYSLLMLFSTLITYLSGIAIERVKKTSLDDKKRIKYMKLCVALSMILNLSILAYFKYFNFFINNINLILSKIHILYTAPQIDVLLPVGISFYTFQALSYTVDVYRDDIYAEKNFFKYALFVSFFPQLVAGPIERSKNLLIQLNEKHTLKYDNLQSGFMLMLYGYFLKMVIADRIALFVDTVYGDYIKYSGWYLIVASILFAFQIYCDFAGYSTIALGAAKIMGFTLTDNFNSPYLSVSIADFWRRWHISLSSWFKDYVYIPLGGNRKGKVRKYINLMIVFLLSGLWHGAKWTFVIWGAINGLYQVIGQLLMPVRNFLNKVLHLDRESFSHRLYHIIGTFILVDISWVFFRAKHVSDAICIIKSIFTADNIHILFDGSLYGHGLNQRNFILMLLAIAVLIFVDICKNKHIVIREFIAKQEFWFRCLSLLLFTLAILIFGIYGANYNETAFIYFQF